MAFYFEPPVTVDNVTLQMTGREISIKNGGVGSTQLADLAVTIAKLAANSKIEVVEYSGNASGAARTVPVGISAKAAAVYHKTMTAGEGILFVTKSSPGVNLDTNSMNSAAFAIDANGDLVVGDAANLFNLAGVDYVAVCFG